MACCESLVIVPGSQGASGTNGTNGTNGVNAYMTLTVACTMPAELATVVATTSDNSAFTLGQVVYVQFLGYMEITAKGSTTSTTLKNLEDAASSAYPGNAPAGTIAPIAALIVPGGVQGPAGALSGAAGGDLSGTYPNPTLAITTTKGDLIVRNATVNVRQGVGADGRRIRANSAAATGVDWALVDLASATEVTGVLPIANGGTAGATAAAARTALGTAESGANSSITSLTGLTTPLSVAQGGTGQTTLPAFVTSLGLGKAIGAIGYFRNDVAFGTGGGGFTTGAFRTMPINTEVIDTGTNFTLAANQITITTAGTYRLFARCPGYKVDQFQAELYDITAAARVTDGLGTLATSPAGGTAQDASYVNVRFTPATVPRVYEIRAFCQTTRAGDGFGVLSVLASGDREIHGEVWIEKEAG